MTKLQSSKTFTSTEFIQMTPATEQTPLVQAQTADSSEFTAAPAVVDVEAVAPALSKAGFGSFWLWGGLVGGFSIVQWGLWLVESWQSSFWQGSLVSLLTVAGLGMMAKLSWTLWQQRRHRKRRHHLQQSWGLMEKPAEAITAVEQLSQLLQQVPEGRQWLAQLPLHYSADEIKFLAEQQLLQTIDQQVQGLIKEAALQTGTAVALSPFALADMLIVAWRSQRLVGDIARLYGAEPNWWQQWQMTRQLLINLLVTGGAEALTDLGSDWFSAELTTKISARAGQGVLAGLLISRFGRLVQQEYRPIPTPVSRLPLKQLVVDLVKKLSNSDN